MVFVPGNHDEALREHVGIAYGEIRLELDYIHTGADGRRWLLCHGDEFDQVTRYHRWLAVLGDHAYAVLVRLNALLSWTRRRLGIAGYWSLSGYAQRMVKETVNFIGESEQAVSHAVKQRDVDGVICGHIHAATIKDLDGITYVNCGDWVDSCTAVIEDADGHMQLIEWGVVPRHAGRNASGETWSGVRPTVSAAPRSPNC